MFVLLLLNCTHTLPQYQETEVRNRIIFSERVGDVIDAEERLQFNLFTAIEDFKSAQFYKNPEGGYDVEISTEQHRLIARNRNRDAITILGEYIDRYEIIKDSMSIFEEKWGIVDYDTLGQPITQDEIRINSEHKWRKGLAGAGAAVGCIGACLISGMPSLAMDVPSDYDYSEEIEKSAIILGATACGGAAGWLLGSKFDERSALRSIKEARKPRIAE
jgi:hypothetical protein